MHLPHSCLHLSPSLFLSSSLAEQFFILLQQPQCQWESTANLYHCFVFHFCPFCPNSWSSFHHPVPPPFFLTDGKNYNDSSEDSTDLIGSCNCHSEDLSLYGKMKRGWKRSWKEGQEQKERGNETWFCSNKRNGLNFAFINHIGCFPIEQFPFVPL